MFISEAFAAANGMAEDPNAFSRMIFQFGIILFVFYLFLIRPQSKKMKAHQQMLDGVEKGNKAITNGGIIGKVIRVDEDEVTLEIAPDVRIRVLKEKLQFVGEYEKSDKTKMAQAATANSNDGEKNKSDKLKEILK